MSQMNPKEVFHNTAYSVTQPVTTFKREVARFTWFPLIKKVIVENSSFPSLFLNQMLGHYIEKPKMKIINFQLENNSHLKFLLRFMFKDKKFHRKSI